MLSFEYNPELALKVACEEAREDGIEEGRLNALLILVKNIMQNASVTATEAMKLIGIPIAEQPKYLAML